MFPLSISFLVFLHVPGTIISAASLSAGGSGELNNNAETLGQEYEQVTQVLQNQIEIVHSESELVRRQMQIFIAGIQVDTMNGTMNNTIQDQDHEQDHEKDHEQDQEE